MKKRTLIFCVLFSCFLFNSVSAQINYQWAKHVGSDWKDVGNSIVVDGAGNSFITGRFGGTADFNPSLSVTNNLSIPALFDCFFAKYDADGNYIWAYPLVLIGSSSFSWGTGITVDPSGNVYITGFFEGTVNFNPSGTFNLVSTGTGTNAFIAKYDGNGGFQWAKQIGGAATDVTSGLGITADATGNVYLTGTFTGVADIDSLGITVHLPNAGMADVFFAKYDTNGNYLWGKSIGGSSQDGAFGIAVDGNNVYITGAFQGTDFNPTGGSGGSPLPSASLADVFFGKYNASDGSFVWAKSIAGSGQDIGQSIAVDGTGNVYLTGSFQGTTSFDAINSYSLTATGLKDVFFAKYATDGHFKWAKKIGSSTNNAIDSCSGSSIVVAQSGNIYLTGYFNGQADFNPLGGDTLIAGAKGDLFFAKYDSTGVYNWAKDVCSDSLSIGYSIAVDNSENVYLTGSFKGIADFDPGYGIENLTSVGNFGAEDIFFAKYRQGTSAIHGIVTKSTGGTVDSGYVKLFTYSANQGAMHLSDVASIDQSGNYSFDYVCADSFIVMAIADTNGYPSIIPTFSHSTTHWNAAQHIIITAPNTTDTANIIMKADSTIISGPAIISGSVREGLCFGCRAQGDPIPGVPIGLEGDPGSIPILATITNDSGTYSFIHLPVGNYKIYVNIPGLPMDSTYHIQITSSDTIKNLNFKVDSSSIYINPVVTSVGQIASSKINMQLVPNPHKGITTIEFTMATANQVQLDAFNLLGEKVAEILNEKEQSGIIRYRFNAANAGLKAGVYLLKLKVGDEVSTIKMVQVE